LKQTLKIGAMLLVVAALATTGVALAQSDDAATTDPATTVEETPIRSKIVEWLAPLVDEGTINQGQAEAVADTLAEALPRPHGPMGHGIEAIREAADFLGLAPEELVEALRDGQTLADLAVANGSSADALIGHLVGLAEAHLDEGIADGRITAEEKADMLEHLTERITASVNGEIERPFLGGPGMGRGRHGGMGDGPCMDDDAEIDELGA
jgi:polyhydroxyalkanoate synthesis regulator phasin